MIDRRTFLTAAGTITVGMLAAGCTRTSAPGEVRLWGFGGAEADVQQEVIDAFLDSYPDVTVRQRMTPASEPGDATYAITAVRGGTAPDLWAMDRFTTAQYAALGLVEPLDDLIAEESPGFEDDWAAFAMDELRYDGHVFGLPFDTDTRGLFYNKATFRQAGLDPDELDPANGPITVARVLELNEVLAEVDGRGNYTRFGLIPWDAQGSALTWMVGRGVEFYNRATGKIQLTSPDVIDVLEQLQAWAQEWSFPRIEAFKATYQPPNSPPAQTSFFGGQQAMVVDASILIQNIRNYAPDLDFGVTYLPVWEPGDDVYTWSGGFSLVAPTGSTLSPAVWELMKYFCGGAGQSIAMNPLAKIPTHLATLAAYEPPGKEEAFMASLLDYSISRPPLPVGQLFSDALGDAQESVLIGSATPREAAEAAQARVQPQLALFEDFELPEGYGEPGL
ncbi:ABC transporter substrate-binding protein [Georgenia deserti]|uniref:ABC transporter substrate-binding protein n=1 Tax=Georgenia deserti TaxID=2093781 RepID=A0ABW4KYU5_9MICO